MLEITTFKCDYKSTFHLSVLNYFCCLLLYMGASLVTQMVENLPTIWETQIWSLGREDRLEKGMATNSSILAWRIPWTEDSLYVNFRINFPSIN